MNNSPSPHSVEQTRDHPTCRALVFWLCASLATAVCEVHAEAPAAPTSLTGASLEELMNVRVTTVSREESTVGESPAAAAVITPEIIHRSGATNIPELLSAVPGREVEHFDSSEWGVASRGFNTRFANKLRVRVDGRTDYTPAKGEVERSA